MPTKSLSGDRRTAGRAVADDPVAGTKQEDTLRELAELKAFIADECRRMAGLLGLTLTHSGEQPEPPVARSPYLTASEAAEYLRMSIQTFYNKTRQIPRVRKGLYRPADLDAWAERRGRRR